MVSKGEKINCSPKSFNIAPKSHPAQKAQKKPSLPDYKFIRPPEAPVFEPSPEEFKDPLEYINKVRSEAEKFGICKIRPPADWQPPFAVDVDKFKLTPRIQRLNELEATTRIKLNFLDQIAKFWELQGSSLKIPVVDKKALDLNTLHKLVHAEGGKDVVNKEQKWSKIATQMGLAGRETPFLLQIHFDRILNPYDIFRQGKEIQRMEVGSDDDNEKKDKDYKPHGIISRQAIKPPCDKYNRRSKRYKDAETPDQGTLLLGEDSDKPTELRRLMFYGAGPKMAGYQAKNDRKSKNKTRGKKVKYDFDPLAKYVCHNCTRGDAEDSMLLCDGCDDSYHTFCLVPPLSEVPKGDWHCPICVAQEVTKPTEAFGFEQAKREYTLHEFGEMADKFKKSYFNMEPHTVPPEIIEQEFWRIVSSIDEDVTVEYGADLHTMDHGSGFPTKEARPPVSDIDEKYCVSGWNLNNIPILEGSVLGHINADISGMKVPWMYVGMCFATFCWHNEDHWTYSINYLHWGEPKTWYGVPGSKAEWFEECMKQAAPELFQSQPDLLHQLVTIMNPNILMEKGVPVCRTDQYAGEFVVTFPRAYHAGFNQGYNFAEAVNFAPADWLNMGRECVSHYSVLRRFCVFSHDELICTMALNPSALNLKIAAATYQDMLQMVEAEKVMRKKLLDWGVTAAKREQFEQIPDDERQCEVCKTTCFLSAVICSCNPEQLTCLRHYDSLCKCSPEMHTLKYRYTLDELPIMLMKLKERAESFDTWLADVKDALEPKSNKTDLDVFRKLFYEAEDKKFPKCELLNKLSKIVEEGENCSKVIQQLCIAKHGSLSIEELELFYEKVQKLKFYLKEEFHLKDLIDRVKLFKSTASTLLDTKSPLAKDIESCISLAAEISVELPELPKLKVILEQMRWVEDVKYKLEEAEEVSTQEIKTLMQKGTSLPSHVAIEKHMVTLHNLLAKLKQVDEKASNILLSGTLPSIAMVEEVLENSQDLLPFLPSLRMLNTNYSKAKAWKAKAQMDHEAELCLYLDELNSFIEEGKSISVQLCELPKLVLTFNHANHWLVKASNFFLRKNSHFLLIDALSPRVAVGIQALKYKKRRFQENNVKPIAPMIMNIKMEGKVHPNDILAAFKAAAENEVLLMRNLRAENLKKKDTEDGFGSYCLCRLGLNGWMFRCELCKEWYHMKCVRPPRRLDGNVNVQIPLNSADVRAFEKYLCPCCVRTRRPPLENMRGLLLLLANITVRIPEGEALQCLAARALEWKDKAHDILSSDQIADAKKKLAGLNLQELSKPAENDCLPVIQSVGSLASQNNDPEQLLQVDLSADIMNKTETPQCQFLDIDKNLLLQLEDLMMEGDLFEITVEETEEIWKILQTTEAYQNRIFKFEEKTDCSRAEKLRSREKIKKISLEESQNFKKVKVIDKNIPKKGKEKVLKEPKVGIKKYKKKGSAQKTTKKNVQEMVDEEEEECAAPNCLKPTEFEVNWVQCDGGCGKWFHLYCIGLELHDIAEDEDYICSICSNNQSNCEQIDEEEVDLSNVKMEVANEGLESFEQSYSAGDPLAVETIDVNPSWPRCKEEPRDFDEIEFDESELVDNDYSCSNQI